MPAAHVTNSGPGVRYYASAAFFERRTDRHEPVSHIAHPNGTVMAATSGAMNAALLRAALEARP